MGVGNGKGGRTPGGRARTSCIAVVATRRRLAGGSGVTARRAEWLALDDRFSEASFIRVWLLASATYGVGDVVTTIALVWFSAGHGEANPAVALAIATFGGGGYLAMKLFGFFACLGISLGVGLPDEDSLFFYGPPLVLAVVGAAITGYNLWLLS